MAKTKKSFNYLFKKLDELNEEAELLDKEAERVIRKNKRLLLYL